MLSKITLKLSNEHNIDIISQNIRSLFSIASCLDSDDDIKSWNNVVKLILTKCKQIIEAGEEEKLSTISFSLMDNLDPNQCPNTTKLYKKNDLDLIVQFGIYISRMDAISLNTREIGLNILETIVTNRRKYFKKKETIYPVIEAAYHFATLKKTDDQTNSTEP